MSQLVDGDFAITAAGSGVLQRVRMQCRISGFNPVRQAERFDPQGTFVRRMIQNWPKRALGKRWNHGNSAVSAATLNP